MSPSCAQLGGLQQEYVLTVKEVLKVYIRCSKTGVYGGGTWLSVNAID